MSAEQIIRLEGDKLPPLSIALKDLIRVEWTSQGMLLVTKAGAFLVTGDNLLLVLFDLVFETGELDLRRAPSPLGPPDWTVTNICRAKSESDLREGDPLQDIRIDEVPADYLIFEMGKRTVLHRHGDLIAVGVRNPKEYWFRIDDFTYLVDLPLAGILAQMGKFTAGCFGTNRDAIVSVNDCANSPIPIERRLIASTIKRQLASSTPESFYASPLPPSFAIGKGAADLTPKRKIGHDI